MDNAISEKIEALTRRVQQLAQQQTTISNQLVQLINEIEALKQQAAGAIVTTPVTQQSIEQPVKTVEVKEVIEAPTRFAAPPTPVAKQATRPATASRTSSSFEEFVGKNVASKVGILVTIIGIFIGAKYAIDHDLVSPLVRVINGYVCGAALIGVAIWLKKKYEAYSSVLMGGGLAVLYFITFIAYSYYHMMPPGAAFGMMLVFTAGTVYAALLYDRVIIAHLALIGAYAIPFLLSDNSGRYAVFFGYIAIINTGILVVSLRKYWKSLYYTAFALTWIIYISWFVFSFNYYQHKFIAWSYLGSYFLIFYITFLAYKIIKKEQYGLHDVFVLLSNAFIFYLLGFKLADHEPANYAGLFTIINAAIHLTVSQVIRRLQLADRSLYYLLLGLVIVFCTIAVPVQLDGNWVTLLWTAEAVLVFWIGRTRQAPAYEKLSVGLSLLSFLSLVHDWFNHADRFTFPESGRVHPFINIVFASGLLIAAAYAAIIYINRNSKYRTGLEAGSPVLIFYNYVFPGIFLITLYFVFQVEINGYFRQFSSQQHGGSGNIFYDTGVGAFGFVVLLLYTMVFTIGCMLVNRRWVRNKTLAAFSAAAIALMMVALLTGVLQLLNELTIAYFEKGYAYFGSFEFAIRYVVIAVTALMLYTSRQSVKAFFPEPWAQRGWLLMVHMVALGFLSAEYLCWTTMRGSDNQYKLGLSILWGLYAMMLVVLGIWKKQKHLRLAGIVLFMVTLIKLFIYDLAGAGTITKTISFISLGVLLLVVSFLYNKYKDVLFGNGEPKDEL
ncbi:DUF2339 domain-containing protein [Niastella populi]|uniref:Beta-carotene 15,15'-monooxygenase n=1 Tax=Niastella populi TaxID=550983 RepID=A0A1V9FCW5_9BACT|nr:DUF2339 domain-containing protein [Niastella populi]OQP56205.1 hypothetical protein A4R26_26575 [Niastella populi]